MGWTGIFNAIRKENGTIDKKATLEREFSGWKNSQSSTRMLKGSMNGSTFYAAMETSGPDGLEVWALVVLTSVNGAEFCYKEMSEDEGPYSYGCPKGILDALTPTTNEHALEWRQKCREQLEKKKAAAGRIPRDAKRLYITFLVNTSASKAGDSVTVEKINDEWIYIDKTGNRWRLLPSHIRNEDIIRIDKAENAEEAARTDAEEAAKRRQEATTSPAIDPDAEKPTEGPSDAKKAQEEPEKLYKYGMKYRGYSIGAQPAGVVDREDDTTGRYYDIISYKEPLTAEQISNYELDDLNQPEPTAEATPQEAPETATTPEAKESTTTERRQPEEVTQEATRAAEAAADHREITATAGKPQRGPTSPGSTAGQADHHKSTPELYKATQTAPGTREGPTRKAHDPAFFKNPIRARAG